uniref:PHD-type domain-containing protein n=2 Tax=Anopheles gambiae TaxID=7165 RepID=A0A1S4GPG2_ANOGA
MSGHNPPHGRLGQPNTTWSPLQVPSYVPRQPQLAHMSSERSMARSPLTWPAPPTTHQDKMYSLMSGNMMNNIEMNPLLQGYGRNVGMPLGSVDLTLSSASRSTPSPKGAHNNVPVPAATGSTHGTHTSSTTLPSNIPTGGGAHGLAGDGGLSGSNHQQARASPSANVGPAPGGVIQSTTVAALKERMQGMGTSLTPGTGGGAGSTSSNSFALTNAINDGSNSSSVISASMMRAGGNGFGAGALNNRTANELAALVSGSLLVKDAKQINSEMDGKNGRDCFSHLESADLVKEFVLQTMHCNALSVSPKRTSPARSSSVQSAALSPTRSRSPPQLNLLLGSSNIDGKLGVDCLTGAFPLPTSNAAVPSLALNTDATASAAEGPDVGSVAARAIGSLLAGGSSHDLSVGASIPACPLANPAASPTGHSMASSEDSVDSSNSRSNGNARRRRKPEKTNKMNAAAFPPEEGKSLFHGAKPSTDGPPTASAMLDELDGLRSNHTGRNDITALAIEGINALSHGLAAAQCDLSQSTSHASAPVEGAGPRAGSGGQPHANDLPHELFRKAGPLAEASPDQQKLLESLIQSNMSANSTVPPVAVAAEDGKLSGTAAAAMNDCETIDKIAAMVSATTAMASKFFADKAGTENGIGDEGLPATSGMHCNGPALPAKDVPEGGGDGENVHKADKKANAADSSYEEVENKLEEMFAGIEEEPEKRTDSVLRAESASSSEDRGSSAVEPVTAAIDSAAPAKNLSDSEVMKQLSNDLAASAAAAAAAAATATGSDSPAGTGSGKKPLTPAQKRSIGSKGGPAGEMATSTPAAKRKRGPKKKSNGKSSVPFLEPEGPPMLGLKALNSKQKKGKPGKKGPAAGKKGKAGGSGNKGKGSKQDERDEGGAWSGAGTNNTSSAEAGGGGKYRGPYVQVKSSGSHTVINAPISEEDGEKTQHKTKKFGNSLNSSERSKIRGLHVSTLSTKYDADTTDTSWMCVFCKTGPHKFRLGDLFGPYIISTASGEYEQSQVDVDFFSVRRTREDLESSQAKQRRAAEKLKEQQQQGGPKGKKRKNAAGAAAAVPGAPAGPSSAKAMALKQEPCDDVVDRSACEIFYGMVKASDNTYEVWTHEDCLVWAPGVYMVGTRIVGLEAAIWNCCRHQCQLCRNYGAVLSCLHQGCHAKAHFICAHKQHWKLTEDFQSFCDRHSGHSGGSVNDVSKVEEVDATGGGGGAVAAATVAPLATTKQLKKEAKSSKETLALTTSAS